jgi:putative endonuclease
MKNHNYFVYITTNPTKTVLYIGITNDLEIRILQHFENRGNAKSFAGKYYCYNLVFYETHQYITDAIEREKEIKKWSRQKKNLLVESLNPSWQFLNEEIKS